MHIQPFMRMLTTLWDHIDTDRAKYRIMAWDADAEAYVPVTGYVIDPETKTVTLQTDEN